MKKHFIALLCVSGTMLPMSPSFRFLQKKVNPRIGLFFAGRALQQAYDEGDTYSNLDNNDDRVLFLQKHNKRLDNICGLVKECGKQGNKSKMIRRAESHFLKSIAVARKESNKALKWFAKNNTPIRRLSVFEKKRIQKEIDDLWRIAERGIKYEKWD